MDIRVAANILLGTTLDNAGSVGLVPFCLTPLMFNQFYADFVDRGEEPIMSQNGFKWLMVMLAVMVTPTASFSGRIFQKIGAAG